MNRFLKARILAIAILGAALLPVHGTAAPQGEVVAAHLDVPWEIVFLPDGSMLATERPGVLRKINKDGFMIPIEGVEHAGEGGLLGMALHPQFEKNGFLYLYSTTSTGKQIQNRVERYTLIKDKLEDRKIILEGIPGSAYHDGGRIGFGPDGYLYITTGDAGNAINAQNLKSLAGKILRVADDGSIPKDNPFKNAVYSYGHRNPQGIAWDEKGQMWATEHGRSGVLSGFDEINLIKKGKNYGWPIVEGDKKKKGMLAPIIHSGPSDTWAPADMVIAKGKIFFTGLRGAALYELSFTKTKKPKLKTYFKNTYGRLRALAAGSDGSLYVGTSNRDGRGEPATDDDKIIRVYVAAVQK